MAVLEVLSLSLVSAYKDVNEDMEFDIGSS